MELKHRGSLKLKTERLTLRKYSLSDAQMFFDNWGKSPENTRGLAWKYHETVEESKNHIQRIIDTYSYPNSYYWIAENERTKECIGDICLYRVNDLNLSAKMGYCISEKFQGNGYATEIAKRVLEYAFDKIEFNRIETDIAVWNDKSVNVVEKCGFSFEGILRQKYYMSPDGFQDTYAYAILKKDYDRQKSSEKSTKE